MLSLIVKLVLISVTRLDIPILLVWFLIVVSPVVYSLCIYIFCCYIFIISGPLNLKINLNTICWDIMLLILYCNFNVNMDAWLDKIYQVILCNYVVVSWTAHSTHYVPLLKKKIVYSWIKIFINSIWRIY